jgi:quinol monooxygenase YgiN
MTFQVDKTKSFEAIFEANKDAISHFDGCSYLSILKDCNQPNVYYTISNWISEDHLEKYRKSKLFNHTWDKTKVLFAEKPQAWSLNPLSNSGQWLKY